MSDSEKENVTHSDDDGNEAGSGAEKSQDKSSQDIFGDQVSSQTTKTTATTPTPSKSPKPTATGEDATKSLETQQKKKEESETEVELAEQPPGSSQTSQPSQET